MRIIRQHVLGGPEVLQLEEAPRPEPGPGEVLVRQAAAGVNPVDWKVRARGRFLGDPPFTVGWDVAGVVEEGEGFEPGERVFGMPRFPKEAAAYAEYVTAPSDELARTPDALSDVETGAIPLAGLTAWQALVDIAGVQPGQRVLILAAAGGVGHFAVQIAKARGAYVIGTARFAKEAFLEELGVDEAVDYTADPVESVVSDVDLVLDLVGGESTQPTIACLRDGGLFIAVPSASALDKLKELAGERVRVTGVLVHPDRAGLEALADLAEAGQLKVSIDQTFPLEQAPQAHQWGETGRTQGKLVLTVD